MPDFPKWKRDETVFFPCCNLIGLKSETHVDAETGLLEDYPAGWKCKACGTIVPEGA